MAWQWHTCTHTLNMPPHMHPCMHTATHLTCTPSHCVFCLQVTVMGSPFTEVAVDFSYVQMGVQLSPGVILAFENLLLFRTRFACVYLCRATGRDRGFVWYI